MTNIATHLRSYLDTHPFDAGQSDCDTVLDLLFQAYQEGHDFDPPEIKSAFQELDLYLSSLPLADNDTGFFLVCKLCLAYEKRAFIDGIQYGAHLYNALFSQSSR